MEEFFNIQFSIYQFDLRFTAPAKFRFSHARSVYHLLCNALQVHPLTYGLIPYPVESGKIFFQAGDPYRFYLTTVGHREAEIEKIRKGIVDFDHWPKPLKLFNHKIRLENLTRLPQPDWQAEADALRGQETITLKFLTPLRIRRETKKGYFDQSYFHLDLFFRRLFKQLDALTRFSQGNTPAAPDSSVPPPPELEQTTRRLLWLDIPGKPALGGVLGTLTLQGNPGNWCLPLALGQYLHGGKNTAFGLGRYVIEGRPAGVRKGCRPASSLSQRVYTPQNLLQAFQEVKKNGGQPGVDGQSIEDFAATLDENLGHLAASLRDKTYASRPLLGVVIGGPENPRALAIPTVRDRIAQRAVVNVVSPSVEQLLDDCSYAYRKGFSRFQARRALELAYREGYRYVLKADIEDFFDTVDWDILFGKVEALFPSEDFVAWIKDWVRQRVVYKSYEIERSRGLPQGAVIAPLLANLYLDEFDEGIRREGFRLVRYADDFIICCKTEEKARQALSLVRQRLADLALALNEEKTHITHFDAGFRYLGFLFCRSVSLEISKDKSRAPETDIQRDWVEKAAPHSWLAAIRSQQPQQILRAGKRRFQLIPLQSEPAEPERGLTVYVTRPEQRIRIKHNRLLISEWREENNAYAEIGGWPIQQVQSVVVNGYVRMALPTVLACVKHNIPLYFCRRDGRLVTATLPLSEGKLWNAALAQLKRSQDADFAVRFSKRIVRAKIDNGRVVLRRRLPEEDDPALDRLKTYSRSCENKKTVDGLRGVEGKAAAEYFSLFASLVDAQWGFSRRLKHPPPDPVNALLSFGYTILYHRCVTALYAAGLNPVVGIFHTPSQRYCALAADLQEEFRFLVDTLVLTLLNEKIVKPEHFQKTASGILLKRDFRKRFLTLVETKLSSRFTFSGDGQKYTYRRFIEKQAEQLKRYIRGSLPDYEPLVVK